MSYVRFYKWQQYVNGEPTGIFKKGELVDDTTYDSYSDCTNVAPLTRWIQTEMTMCDGYDLCYVDKEQISYDEGTSWSDTGNTRPGNVIEYGSSQCVSSDWRIVPGEYVCEVFDKYTKEQEWQLIEGVWTPTQNYRKGTLIERESPDCTEPVYTLKATQVYENGGMVEIPLNGSSILTGREITTRITCEPCSDVYYLSSITVYDTVTEIESDCLSTKNRLTSVVLPDTITTIGDYAFSSDYALESINLPNSITSIGYGAFDSCNLNNVSPLVLPNRLTRIEGYTFRLTNIHSVVLPDTLQFIGEGAFRNTPLTSIVIPNSVTEIQNYAFDGCKRIRTVVIGSGVTSIGYMAFHPNGVSDYESITCLATTPPTLSTYNFTTTNNCPIYVPAASVNAYKAANNWNAMAQRIQPIP